MPEQPRPQLHVDAVRCVCEDVCAQAAQRRFEQRDGRKADHQNIQRGKAPVHQHLVDHHLEEQRRKQREDLQEQRRRQHLPQNPAVFVNRAQEP
jgi:hypothetical protein